MVEALITLIVFASIYHILKLFTDFLLKRKIIKAGHIDKAGILEAEKNEEENTYPTLKWGLVALFAGIGLLVISLLNLETHEHWYDGGHSYLPIGIELIAISLGFLTYFFIMIARKKG